MAVKFGHIVHVENFLKVNCISGKPLEGSICWFLSKSPRKIIKIAFATREIFLVYNCKFCCFYYWLALF